VSRIGPGEVQRMSAGTGVRHSEYNASDAKPLRLVQLWILPAVKGLEPSWEQRTFTREERAGKLLPVAVPSKLETRDSKLDAVRIHQDATIYASLLQPGDQVKHSLVPGRRAYLFVVSGDVELNGKPLRAGDQARVTGERELPLRATADAELLLLDLP
jgi:hypothetical protein